MKPFGVQLQRRRGWVMPDNTRSVTRPGRWGNPYYVAPSVALRTRNKRPESFACKTALEAMTKFENYILTAHYGKLLLAAARKELTGRNLACYCELGTPCHRDVWLKLLNNE